MSNGDSRPQQPGLNELMARFTEKMESGEYRTRSSFQPPTQSEMPLGPKKAIKGGKISMETSIRLADVARKIHERDAAESRDLGFFSQLLVQVTMPHSDPGEVVGWRRRNGDVQILIQPGIGENAQGELVSLGLPFGTYPRLFVLWMSTEVVRTNSPRLDLGETYNEFMRKLGIARSGGKEGSDPRLQNQLRRFLHSSFSWEYRHGNMLVGQDIKPIQETQLLWDPKKPDQTGFWASSLTLNPLFFNHLLKHHVPVDTRVIRELARQRSSMGIDIYCWLTHRMSYLRKPSPLLSWSTLMAQFGTGYTDPDNFCRYFKAELKKVLVLYPGARVEAVRGGIKLLPSATHVRRFSAPVKALRGSDSAE